MRPFACSATLFALSACAPHAADDALPAGALAPPAPFTLTATQVQPDAWVRLTADVGVPGANVYLTQSLTGAGAGICPRPLRGACLGVLNPMLPEVAIADGAGVSTWDVFVGPDYAGRDVWFQAGLPRGRQQARMSNVVHRRGMDTADLYFPRMPDGERAWHAAYGYGPLGAPDELWWNNSELCLTGRHLGAGPDADLSWRDLPPTPVGYICHTLRQGGGDAFLLQHEDGALSVVRVGDDYTTTFEDPASLVNTVGLRLYPDADAFDRVALTTSAGHAGFVVGTGTVALGQPHDVWWNGAELCMTGAPLGTFGAPREIVLDDYETTPVTAECWFAQQGGTEAFVVETMAGTRAVLWVEPSYTWGLEPSGVNEIGLRVVR